MKSIGKQEAALKDEIEFSLNALILRSDDCNTFIPCPLCPITKNFGILYALLPNSKPKKKIIQTTTHTSISYVFLLLVMSYVHEIKIKVTGVVTAYLNRLEWYDYLWRGEWSRERKRDSQGPGRGLGRRRHEQLWEPLFWFLERENKNNKETQLVYRR